MQRHPKPASKTNKLTSSEVDVLGTESMPSGRQKLAGRRGVALRRRREQVRRPGVLWTSSEQPRRQ